MQQPTKQITKLVQNIENSSYELKVQMIQLDTVQDAVAQLMERIDEIKYKGWDKDRAMAYLAIGEIERTVRLIDMAFLPLKRKMDETIGELNVSSKKTFELIVQEKNIDEGGKTNETI